jgi:hypothetical protein
VCVYDYPSGMSACVGDFPGALLADCDGGGGSGDEGSARGEGDDVKGGEAAAGGGSPALALASPKVCVFSCVCICACMRVGCEACARSLRAWALRMRAAGVVAPWLCALPPLLVCACMNDAHLVQSSHQASNVHRAPLTQRDVGPSHPTGGARWKLIPFCVLVGVSAGAG